MVQEVPEVPEGPVGQEVLLKAPLAQWVRQVVPELRVTQGYLVLQWLQSHL